MAERELAILLKARDLASGPIRGVSKDLKGLNSVAGRAGKGVGTAALNLKRIGIAGAAGVAVGGLAAIKSGLDSLAERGNVIAGTTAAIKSQGKAATVTAGQVRNWSEELETATGAAVDDKAIQAAATSLIRFGTIGENQFKRTLAAATDLGAGMKTGPEAGAKLLGKAMSDPIKGMTALRKAGIILTEAEQKRIKQLVEGNKVQEAQAVILGAVEKRYKGAAAAVDPAIRAQNLLADASEDAKMALAEGFLPVLTKVSNKISTAVANPRVIASIREVGTGLANGFDKALTAAEKIPWGTIGDSMKLAGQGAKAAFDLFTGLPPWVQTAVLTGWGLNKLTGGALTGIAGELGKGLIKGVLGMNAGVVNINAGTVTGAGGVPGVAGAAASGGLSGIQKMFLVGEAIGLAALVNEVRTGVEGGITTQAQGVRNDANVWLQQSPAVADLKSGLAAVDTAINQMQTDPIGMLLVGGPGLEELRATRAAIQTKLDYNTSVTKDMATRTKDDLTAVGLKQVTAANQTRDRVESTRIATNTASSIAASAQAALRAKVESAGILARSGGLAAAAAIRNKKTSVTVNVAAPAVSIRNFINGSLVYGQYSKTSATTRAYY